MKYLLSLFLLTSLISIKAMDNPKDTPKDVNQRQQQKMNEDAARLQSDISLIGCYTGNPLLCVQHAMYELERFHQMQNDFEKKDQ